MVVEAVGAAIGVSYVPAPACGPHSRSASRGCGMGVTCAAAGGVCARSGGRARRRVRARIIRVGAVRIRVRRVGVRMGCIRMRGVRVGVIRVRCVGVRRGGGMRSWRFWRRRRRFLILGRNK